MQKVHASAAAAAAPRLAREGAHLRAGMPCVCTRVLVGVGATSDKRQTTGGGGPYRVLVCGQGDNCARRLGCVWHEERRPHVDGVDGRDARVIIGWVDTREATDGGIPIGHVDVASVDAAANRRGQEAAGDKRGGSDAALKVRHLGPAKGVVVTARRAAPTATARRGSSGVRVGG